MDNAWNGVFLHNAFPNVVLCEWVVVDFRRIRIPGVVELFPPHNLENVSCTWIFLKTI